MQRNGCPHCGALNPTNSAYCGLCYQSFTPRAHGGESSGGDPSPVAEAPIQNRQTWRWSHLALLSMVTWGVPMLLVLTVAGRANLTELLDVTLILQVVGYSSGLAVTYALVKQNHGGKWETLGLRSSADAPFELLRGAGLGTALIAVVLAFGFLAGVRRLPFDGLVSALVGETTGPGLLLATLVTVVGAPVIEEIYFRGLLFDWFGRRGSLAAVAGTSVMFTLAHGTLVILPLLLLGVVLGVARLRRSLWFTMGAHAAWNLAVVSLAAWFILGPAKQFVSNDGAYQFRYASTWHAEQDLEIGIPGGRIEIGLVRTGGSVVSVTGIIKPPGEARTALALLSSGLLHGSIAGGAPYNKHPATLSLDLSTPFIDVSRRTTVGGVPVADRVLVLVPPSVDRALVFQLVCPRQSCDRAESDFETMLESLSFDP